MRIKILGVKGLSLYSYEGKVRELLLRYKEGNDKYLARCFLWDFGMYLRLRYKRWVFVCAPSRIESQRIRGFKHLELMLNHYGIESLDALENTSQEDQTKSKDRQEILKHIHVRDIEQIRNKSVVLFDDISTSESTLTACILALKPHVRRIRIVVFSSIRVG